MNSKKNRRQPYFCIATTTYNMGDFIYRTYQSILKQTYHYFYWLVIDNGSEDDTAHVIQTCMQEHKIDIEYVKIKHGIRAAAINAMLDHVRGDLCVEIHADDALYPNALDIFAREWMRIPDKKRQGIWAMAALCADSHEGRTVGKEFPKNINRRPGRAWKYQFHTIGEKHYAMNTDIIKTKRIHTDIPDRVVYIGEDLLWIEFQREYLMWFINCRTRIYYDDASNRATQKIVFPEMRDAVYYSHLKILNTFFRFDKKPFFEYLKHAGICFYNGCMTGRTMNRVKRELFAADTKILLLLAWPWIIIRKRIRER